MQHVHEFLVWNVALAEDVMILEELKQADAVLLALILNLTHECIVAGMITREVSPFLDICRFKLGCRSVNGIFEAVSIF